MAADATTSGNARGRDAGGLARLLCLGLGVVLVAAGVLGFFVQQGSSFTQISPDFQSATGFDTSGTLLGFAVNGWHNIVHIATGVLLLVFGLKKSSARTGLLVFAILYVVIAVVSFALDSPLLGLIPINGADKGLHVALAILGIVLFVLTGVLASRGGRSKPNKGGPNKGGGGEKRRREALADTSGPGKGDHDHDHDHDHDREGGQPTVGARSVSVIAKDGETEGRDVPRIDSLRPGHDGASAHGAESKPEADDR